MSHRAPALIAGGSRGIGRAIALALADVHRDVLINGSGKHFVPGFSESLLLDVHDSGETAVS